MLGVRLGLVYSNFSLKSDGDRLISASELYRPFLIHLCSYSLVQFVTGGCWIGVDVDVT